MRQVLGHRGGIPGPAGDGAVKGQQHAVHAKATVIRGPGPGPNRAGVGGDRLRHERVGRYLRAVM